MKSSKFSESTSDWRGNFLCGVLYLAHCLLTTMWYAFISWSPWDRFQSPALEAFEHKLGTFHFGEALIIHTYMEVSKCQVNSLVGHPGNFSSLKCTSISLNLLDRANYVEVLILFWMLSGKLLVWFIGVRYLASWLDRLIFLWNNHRVGKCLKLVGLRYDEWSESNGSRNFLWLVYLIRRIVWPYILRLDSKSVTKLCTGKALKPGVESACVRYWKIFLSVLYGKVTSFVESVVAWHLEIWETKVYFSIPRL